MNPSFAIYLGLAACICLHPNLSAQEGAESEAGVSMEWRDPITDPPDLVGDLFSKYQTAEYPLLESIRSLNQNFVSHLKTMVAEKQAEGKLHEVIEITDSITALTQGRPLTTTFESSDLAKAVLVYQKSLLERESSVAPGMSRLLKAYREQLKNYSTRLTQDGDLETALAVSNYVESWSEKFDKFETLAALSDPNLRGKIDWNFVSNAIQNEHLERIEHRQLDRTTYYDVGSQPSVLIGLKLNFDDISKERVVRGFQAIFANQDKGEVTSDISQGTRNPDTTRRVIGKNGFAVGAVEVKMDPHVRQVRIHFYRIVGKQLNPADNYTSEWYGDWPEEGLLEKVDAGTRIPVGVHGKSGLGVDSIGLVVINPH
ncbi:MAG: hypothetical protein AAGA96_09610 [Verrucomicrobiota bacterium]